MKDIDNILGAVGETVEYARQYVEQGIEYYKLEAAEKTAKSVSAIIYGILLIVLLFFTIIMLSIAAGFYAGQIFDSNTLGFLAVAGFYFFCIIIIALFKVNIITNPVTARVLQAFFSKKEKLPKG